MPKAKPIIHTELADARNREISATDEVTLSDSQLDWLAEFFAPLVKKSMEKEGTSGGKRKIAL